jgi:LPXTG-motif cell wall-anchored protein
VNSGLPELALAFLLPLAQAAPELAEPYGITDPTNIVFPQFPWLWIVAVGLACVVLGLLTLFFLKRKKRPAPYVSAADIALRRLTELEKSAGELDSYHFSIGVDDVLRDYLSRVLGIRAEHQTSQEFLRTLDLRGGLREQLITVLRNFLETSDAFKFARIPGGSKENLELLQRAREVVEGSRR